MSVKDFARDKSGKSVYPWSLKLSPSAQVKNLFPDDMVNNNRQAYQDQLPTVPENAVLFEVYAMANPEELGGKYERIGDLKLDGKLVKSAWADAHLFFRHETLDAAIAEHPEWDKYESKWGIFGKLAADFEASEVSFAQDSLECDAELSIDNIHAEECASVYERIDVSNLSEDQKTILVQKYDAQCAEKATKKFFENLKNPEFRKKMAKLAAAAKASGNEAKFWKGMK